MGCKDNELKQIESLCEPILEFLERNHNPYIELRITPERIEILERTIGIPVKKTAD